ncbi:MAG TPA: CotH kinase family protein, partial [Candidatus Paceibacterota bacterium]|nr:CotH kinase family protein [Candidatus Paceibacterota bacterium]
MLRRDPAFPVDRAAFGLALLCFCLTAWSGSITLLPPAGQGMFLRGLGEASSPDTGAWRQPAFDDRGWEAAQFPLFHGLALSGTRLSDMPGGYTSVYVRRCFVVEDPAEIVRLELGAVCDGGYAAWINGQEVRRSNVRTGDLTFDDTALIELPDPALFEAEEFETWRGLLVAGTNVLALQAFSSSSADDADFVFDASLLATLDEDLPVINAVEPPPGSVLRALHSIEVQFSEPVQGVDAADLLVNGNPATEVIEVAPGDFLFTVGPLGDGTVAVAWRVDHGITDAVGARHPFAAEGWSYVVDAASPSPALVLSEFMADNKRTLNDEDGDSSDWIEVYNSGSDTASLAGWFLTDDPANLAKWCFPEIELAAGGYRVVFASGKDRANPAAKLHTNFKLAAEGGFLALVDPAGQIVSHFGAAYPGQVTDVSYGRVLGEGHALGYFTKPTPGAPNAASGPGFAPEVQFSRPGGTFTNAFALTLSSSLGGALIRYTLDGNLPTNGSVLYEGPIVITNSVQVRARAFADGLLPGPPRSEAYVLLATNVLGFTSDLPVFVLHSQGKGTPSSIRMNFAQLAVFEPKAGRTRLTDEPTLNVRAGVQIRGSSTEGLAKSSYKLELWDEFEMDRKQSLLGLPADSDWVLYAPNQFEPVLIHNPFIHQISRDMGCYSPRTRFVEVYFNRGKGPLTSTHYAGIYVLEEKIKIGPERLAIDELEPENLAPPSVTGGYVLKFDRLDPGDVGLAAGGATLAYVDPKEREIRLAQRRPQQNYIRDYINAFYKALMATNWLDPHLGYRAYIDVDAAIDYHVLEVLSGNVDALVLSAYLHKPRNGRITFGPHWDFDRALGSTDGRDSNPRLWATGPFFSAAWWNRMFTDKDFWQRWVD